MIIQWREFPGFKVEEGEEEEEEKEEGSEVLENQSDQSLAGIFALD